MTIAVDFYIERRSWLHAVDPRVKFLLIVCAMVLLVLIKNLFLMFIGVGLALLLHVSAQIPRDKVFFLLRALLPVSLLMPAIWILFYPSGEAIFSLWALRVTPMAIVHGVTAALRINCMTLIVFSWLYTTDHPSTVRALVKLKLPFAWGLILSLSLRLIPNFQRAYRQVVDAQQARGLDLESARGYKWMRLQMPIFVAMVISSFRAGELLAKALEARAFGASGLTRTYYREIAFGRRDIIYAVILLLLTAVILWLYARFGFGRDPLQFFL